MNKVTQILVWLIAAFLFWHHVIDKNALNTVYVAEQTTNNAKATSQNDYAQMLSRVMPKVISVHSDVSHPYFNAFINPLNKPQDLPQSSAAGSGVIVSNKGHVMTNYHVIDGAESIAVKYQGKDYEAMIIGFDEATDLALLKINATTEPIVFIDSDDAEVGDVVFAIGNPFNIGETVTKGIVSALGRENLDLNLFANFIQTDAAINIGNSGGALINENGQLLGINTAILSSSGTSSGVSFAIPSNMVREVFTALLDHGKVVRGFLGIGIHERDGSVFVTQVMANTGAARAGILSGDEILRVEGVEINSAKQLIKLISSYQPSEKLDVDIMRNQQQETLQVIITER